MRETGAQQRMLLQLGNDRFHIGFGIEQADNVGIAPQAGFPGSGSNTGVSCVSWKVMETDPASISASLRSSAFAPVVFSFSWIHGIAKLFIYQ
jgi:hypothetical protein